MILTKNNHCCGPDVWVEKLWYLKKSAFSLPKTSNHLQYPSRKFFWIYLKTEKRKRKKEWVKGELFTAWWMSAWTLCLVRAWLLWPTLWCGHHDSQARMEKSGWKGDLRCVPKLAQIDKDIVEEPWLLRARRDGRSGIQGERESQRISSNSKENLLHNPATGEREDLGHAFAISNAEFQRRLSLLPQQLRSGAKEKPKIEIATFMWMHSISKSIFDSTNGRFLPRKSHGSLLLPHRWF